MKFTITGCLALFFFCFGCDAVDHPNQISTQDGQTYDTLLATHQALTVLKAEESKYPQFKADVNLAINSFDATAAEYLLFHAGSPAIKPSSMAADLSQTVAEFEDAEDALQKALGVEPETIKKVLRAHRKDGLRMARIVSRPNLSLIDILTYLQAAAQVAASIPVSSEYGQIAETIISATEAAVGSASQTTGTPIDVSLIASITPIP